jgi:hypothetical protein
LFAILLFKNQIMNRIFFLIVLFFCACNSQNEQQANNDLDQTNRKIDGTTVDLEGCYVSIFKKDTAYLKLIKENNQITGSLIYKRFEKDNNTGTITGKIADTLIVADYTFKSEGMTSVRQVVFKISGDQLIEGFGDINIGKSGDSAKFKNLSQLKFQEEQPFVKEDCQ